MENNESNKIEKEKNNKNVNKIRTRVWIVLMILIFAMLFYIVYTINTQISQNDKHSQANSNSYREVSINGKVYYERIGSKTWQGRYNQDTFETSSQSAEMKVVSYEDYLKAIYEIDMIAEDKIKPYYKNVNCNYIILSYSNGKSWCKIDLIDCIEENGEIIIYGDEETNGVMASGSGYFIAIPTTMPAGTKVIYRECLSYPEISNLKKYNDIYDPTEIPSCDKPVIYLYPEKETQLTVKLGKKENITCSYPQYKDGWNVIAKPDGTLIDTETGRKLYSLYWEGIHTEEPDTTEGFVVKGSDTIKFLEEKLAILGLNEFEAEEFIIYWLPKMQNNKYNYIRFATMDEINRNMPLEISTKPDTVIRVLMQYKALDSEIEVKEQQLSTPERRGFTVVEWGGTELGNLQDIVF